jgi:hypothetical protein
MAFREMIIVIIQFSNPFSSFTGSVCRDCHLVHYNFAHVVLAPCSDIPDRTSPSSSKRRTIFMSTDGWRPISRSIEAAWLTAGHQISSHVEHSRSERAYRQRCDCEEIDHQHGLRETAAAGYPSFQIESHDLPNNEASPSA